MSATKYTDKMSDKSFKGFTTYLQNKLNALGDNAYGVASTLQVKGVKGLKQDSQQCALAVYLGRNSKKYVYSVGDRSVTIYEKRPGKDVWARRGEAIGSFDHPHRDFVVQFDKGFFPGLEKTKS